MLNSKARTVVRMAQTGLRAAWSSWPRTHDSWGALRANARISFAIASTAARHTGRSSGSSSPPTPGPLELTQSSDAAHPAPASPATSSLLRQKRQRPHRRGGDPSSPALRCDARGWCNSDSRYPPPSRSIPTAVLVTCRRSRGMVRPDPCVDLMDLARSRLDGEEVRGLWPRGRVPDPGDRKSVV